MIYDVIIAGAGVSGGLIARELTKYKLSCCVLEKSGDVAMGASKANSGIIHGGFDPEPGTLKAKLNVSGVPLLYEAAKELNVPHKNCGSLVIAFDDDQVKTLKALYERGIENGLCDSDMEIISGETAREIEPALSNEVCGALLVKNAGIICPYYLTIAAVGNAMDNGAALKLGFKICKIEKDENGCFVVEAENGEKVTGKYLVNCAGVFSGEIARLAGDDYIEIIPRAGEYLLLDKTEGKTVSHTIFQVPTANGKGILVTPTADGNLLLGPTADKVEDPEDTATTAAGLNRVAALAKKSVPALNTGAVITSFSGVRASEKGGDFIIKISEKVKNLINVAAIDSPGLTSCVAIAKYATELLKESGLKLEKNLAFNGTRKDYHAFAKMSESEKNEYISENPLFGRVICRCENVSEGEIVEAIKANPPASDVDGVKRRTRAGMGRCQSGFCAPYVMRIIARERGADMRDITKKGGASFMVESETRANFAENAKKENENG